MAGPAARRTWSDPRLRIPRRPSAVVLVAVTLTGLAVSRSAIVIVALLLLGTLAVAPTWRPRAAWLLDAAAWLPAGAVAVLGTGILVIVPTSAAGLPVLGSPLVLAVLAVLLGAGAWWRGGGVGVWSPVSLVAWLPAAVVAVAQGYRLAQPLSSWSRPTWVLTDPISHARMVVDAVVAGRLSYDLADQSAQDGLALYPRGLHVLLASLVGVDAPSGAAADSWEPALWWVWAALAASAVPAIAATCLLAVQVLRRAGHASVPAVVATVLVLGLLMLHPDSYRILFENGFLTSSATAVMLAVLLLVADAGPRGRGLSVRLIASMGLVVCALYLWQVMAVPVALVALLIAIRWWRTGRGRSRLVVVAGVGAVLLCVPLALATVSTKGVTQASAVAAVTPVGALTTFVAVAAAIATVCATRLRRSLLGQAAIVLLVVTMVIGIVLAVVGGTSPLDPSYYASKTLWHARTVALPFAVAGAVLAVRAAWRSPAFARRVPSALVRALAIVAPIVLVLAAVGGWLSFGLGRTLGELAAPGGPSPQVPLAVLTDEAVAAAPGRPVLPWQLNPQGWQLWLRYDDWNAAQVLRTMGHPVPGPGALLGRDMGAVCRWLRENPDAVRLTGPRLGMGQLLDAGCPEEVVRPEEWRVVVTPADWWAGTAWEATGGAPDPGIRMPDGPLDSLAG